MDVNDKEKQHQKQNRTTPMDMTWRLALAVLGAVLGMFQVGYNVGVINVPQLVIEAFYNRSTLSRHGVNMAGRDLTLVWALTVAIFAFGAVLGSSCASFWTDRFGRKGGMLWNTVFGLIGAILMASSRAANSLEIIVIGRLVLGFHGGLNTCLAPTYNAEIASPRNRGTIGTVNQFAVVAGILCSQVLGLSVVLGNDKYWTLLLGLTALPPLLQLVILPWCPESPRYLLLHKHQELHATQALWCLRGAKYDVRRELAEMQEEAMANQNGEEKGIAIGIIQLFTTRKLRMPLLVAVVVHLSQQLSVMNCISFYSTSLFINVGLDCVTAQYTSLAMGGVLLITTGATVPLMDRVGRRPLLLTGLAGMIAFGIAFTITLFFAVKTASIVLQTLSIINALFITLFFALGPGVIPWLIVPEFFSQAPRSAAMAVGGFTNWMGNFIVGLAFPSMQATLGSFNFLPFTALTIVFFFILYKYLPETKGKSFQEITAIFSAAENAVKKPVSESTPQENETKLHPKYKTFDNPAQNDDL